MEDFANTAISPSELFFFSLLLHCKRFEVIEEILIEFKYTKLINEKRRVTCTSRRDLSSLAFVIEKYIFIELKNFDSMNHFMFKQTYVRNVHTFYTKNTITSLINFDV